MFALVVIAVFVLIIAVIIYVEYRNEKAYQEERKNRTNERKKTKPPYSPKEKIQKPQRLKKEKKEKLQESTPGAKQKGQAQEKKKLEDAYALKDDTNYVQTPRKVASAKELREAEAQQELEEKRLEVQKSEEEKSEPKVTPESEVSEKIDLPECNYPKFDYSRLVGMGLSEDEAVEFIKELIPQIKTQIPLIKEAMQKEDFHSMERLTHSIKGSSTTVGSGGISDLLVEYNTYLKTGKERSVVESYFEHLNRYAEDLEKEYA